MKKVVLLFVAVIICASAAAQSSKDIASELGISVKDELVLSYLYQITRQMASNYKLYPTENLWTFLELETFSGRIWQVQYSIKGPNYRFKTLLNDNSLVPLQDTDGGFAGRFELYKTQNMYNFILLDTVSGDTWQVQWSTEVGDRAVIKIR